MLLPFYEENRIEAGCDEAGRGCLAGPVFAAAVIFDKDYTHDWLNDSKQLNAAQRDSLRAVIEKDALAFAVASVSPAEIDEINIFQASFLAMHRALSSLKTVPEHLLIDGNHFVPYLDIPHLCIVKGDSKYLSIAAASVLAKTYRDDYMRKICKEYPHYGWSQNKGYATANHRSTTLAHGLSPHHRRTFKVKEPPLKLTP